MDNFPQFLDVAAPPRIVLQAVRKRAFLAGRREQPKEEGSKMCRKKQDSRGVRMKASTQTDLSMRIDDASRRKTRCCARCYGVKP